MNFNVESEVAALCTAYGAKSDRFRLALIKLLNRAIAATEEADIKAVCLDCRDGDVPHYSKDGMWRHRWQWGGEMCRAAAIHERRREREEPK